MYSRISIKSKGIHNLSIKQLMTFFQALLNGKPICTFNSGVDVIEIEDETTFERSNKQEDNLR